MSDNEKNNNEKPAAETSAERQRRPMSRKARHSLVSGGICLLVIVSVVLVNVITVVMTNKFSALTADITAMKSFEISEQSKNIAQNISKKVTITFLTERTAYMEIDPYCKQTAYMTEEMEKCANGMIEVNYVDLVRNPTFADNYSSEDLSTTDIIVACGENRRILKVADMFKFENYSDNYQYIASSHSEEVLDSAIIAVTNEEITHTVLIKDYCSQDTSYFLKTLRNNGYDTTEISLLSGNIPADTEMAVVYAPTADYTEEAVNKLRSFLNNNGEYGKTLLFLSESQDVEMPNLDKLLSEYGMGLEHGFAFEADSNYVNSSSANYFDGVLCQYFSDLYTDYLKDKPRPVITGYSRPVSILNAAAAAPLLSYSDYSGECPFDADENWNISDAITGNTFVLAQGQMGKESSPSTLIVSGTYRIFTKSYYGSAYSNQTYLSTMLASANHRKINRVTVAEKVINSFDVNINQQTAMNLGFVVYALIPIVILGIGFTVFLMRRNR